MNQSDEDAARELANMERFISACRCLIEGTPEPIQVELEQAFARIRADEHEKLCMELCRILHPNGIKHPDSTKWNWLLHTVRGLEAKGRKQGMMECLQQARYMNSRAGNLDGFIDYIHQAAEKMEES